MKQRNPEATCGNCPYWLKGSNQPSAYDSKVGYHGRCKRYAPNPEAIAFSSERDWCGEHPNFFLVQKVIP